MSTPTTTTDIAVVPKRIGAPTLYRPEYCAAVVAYFEAAIDQAGRTLSDSTTDTTGGPGGGSTKELMRHITAELPTLEGFARSIGTSRKTLLDWQNRHEEFRLACARGKDIQCMLLTDRGLNGQYNAQYAQFVAKNVTWMKDKTEVETVVSQDTEAMATMRQALSTATPEELQTIRTLFDRMQARTPAIDPVT